MKEEIKYFNTFKDIDITEEFICLHTSTDSKDCTQGYGLYLSTFYLHMTSGKYKDLTLLTFIVDNVDYTLRIKSDPKQISFNGDIQYRYECDLITDSLHTFIPCNYKELNFKVTCKDIIKEKYKVTYKLLED